MHQLDLFYDAPAGTFPAPMVGGISWVNCIYKGRLIIIPVPARFMQNGQAASYCRGYIKGGGQ